MNAPKVDRLVAPLPMVRPGMLSLRDARELKRLLTLLSEGEDDYAWSLAPPRPWELGTGATEKLVEEARFLRDSRRRRGHYFPATIFGEIGWDLLISSYIADGREKLSTSRLTQLAGAPMTSVLRWLCFLEAEALVRGRTDPFDGRVKIIELTDKGRGAIDAYLEDLLRKREV